MSKQFSLKTSIGFILLLLIPATLVAQLSFAPVIGACLANGHIRLDNEYYSTAAINGIRVGAEAGYNIHKHLRLQSGVIYNTNGYSLQKGMAGIDRNLRFRTIELPLYLQYKGGKPRHQGFFIGGGGYLGINASGSYIQTSHTMPRNFTIGKDSGSDIVPVTFGCAMNAGYQSVKHLFVRIGYQLSLTDLTPKNTSGSSYYSNQLNLVIGYTIFDRKKKKQQQATSTNK
ncbi:MAG: PorT family protein [Flavipsychrobacter sp.]|nr:PorT family protein [Flavipsychrobacter sp.]